VGCGLKPMRWVDGGPGVGFRRSNTRPIRIGALRLGGSHGGRCTLRECVSGRDTS
jgi:hypothetical protein